MLLSINVKISLYHTYYSYYYHLLIPLLHQYHGNKKLRAVEMSLGALAPWRLSARVECSTSCSRSSVLLGDVRTHAPASWLQVACLWRAWRADGEHADPLRHSRAGKAAKSLWLCLTLVFGSRCCS